MILRIFDCKNGLLISLLELLRLLSSKFPRLKDQKWTVERVVANNGVNACQMEESLNAGEKMEVCLNELTEWLQQGEVFTSIKLHCSVEHIRIGVEDSTYLFIESRNQDLIEDIGSKFQHAQVVG